MLRTLPRRLHGLLSRTCSRLYGRRFWYRKEKGVSIMSMGWTALENETYRELLEHVERYLGRWKEPTPRFEYRVGWSTTYERLFLEQFDETTLIESLLHKADASGRV